MQTESSWGGSDKYGRSPPASQPSTFYEVENQDYHRTRERPIIYEDPESLESRMSDASLSAKDDDFEFVLNQG
jgi:hypothetical protein